MIETVRRFLPRGKPLYRDALYLAAHVPIEPDAARAWLPAGLRLARPGTAILFGAHFRDCSFDSVYEEVGLLIDVRHLGFRAVHCPWMLVNGDVALILGRELLGYPKKLADIRWSQTDHAIEVRAERRGVDILSISARLGGEVQSAPPMLGRPHRNVVGALGVIPPSLVAFSPREQVRSVRAAKIELDIGHSERDPLDELGIGLPQAGYLYRVDLWASLPPVPVRLLSPTHLLRHFRRRHH